MYILVSYLLLFIAKDNEGGPNISHPFASASFTLNLNSPKCEDSIIS